MLNLQKTMNDIKNAADWVSLRHVSEKTTWRSVRDDKPAVNSTRFSEGVMVEVLVDGQFAYAGTSDLSDLGVKRALEQALLLAKKSAPYKVHPFTLEQRRVSQGRYSSPVLKSLD